MSPRGSKAPNVKDVDPLSFGGQLRRFREEAGLSQEELGEAIGLNQQRISLYERNVNIPEQEDVLMAMAEVLGIPPGRLFEATRFNGALIVGSERRERLKQMHEKDWDLFDRFYDSMQGMTPEIRAEFERGLANYLELERWRK